MNVLTATRRFEKDAKLCQKRGYPMQKLRKVLNLLEIDSHLPLNYRPHKLVGNWEGTWECHIEPDWLLIYEIRNKEILLLRTGTHSDLFKK